MLLMRPQGCRFTELICAGIPLLSLFQILLSGAEVTRNLITETKINQRGRQPGEVGHPCFVHVIGKNHLKLNIRHGNKQICDL